MNQNIVHVYKNSFSGLEYHYDMTIRFGGNSVAISGRAQQISNKFINFERKSHIDTIKINGKQSFQ